MLGNLLTSLVAGLGTYVWLVIFGVPYRCSWLFSSACSTSSRWSGRRSPVPWSRWSRSPRDFRSPSPRSPSTSIYRFLEDYLLNPRVMKHTVRITPGITIIATLIGGTLLGLVGALIAIPVAATINLLLEEVAIPRQNKR